MLRIFCADEFLQKNENEMFVQNTLSKFRWSKLNKQILNKWSSMETSQGIFGIQRKCGFLFLFQMYLKMKTKSKTKKKGIAKFKSENLAIKNELPFSLILDNVRDPG